VLEEDNKENEKQLGLIPDFFHDIIAYIIPGLAFILLLIVDWYLVKPIELGKLGDYSLLILSAVFVVAYISGRFFEQLGLISIHSRAPIFIKKIFKYSLSPKWSLIFDENSPKYTCSFRCNVQSKITEWLSKQQGEKLIDECKKETKDDYFNLIQFYLRERFPNIALYEKKQNATIILSRSLSLIFFSSIFIYHIMLFCNSELGNISLNCKSISFWWCASQLFISIIFYSRFVTDKKYHAMYIFEAFIATKKLLRSK